MTETETGLPELPDGFFWRVRKGTITVFDYEQHYPRLASYNQYSYFDGAYISIVGTKLQTSKFGRISEVQYETYKEPVKTALPPDNIEGGYKDETGIRWSYEITADAILSSAERALPKWQQEVAIREADKIKKARVTALMGDYPPKTLKG